jgi:hypothetical protein
LFAKQAINLTKNQYLLRVFYNTIKLTLTEMMNEKSTSQDAENLNEEKAGNSTLLNRRKFIGGVTTAALAMTIVPRHVLGGSGFVAPSDKVTLAYIGAGTQGLRELLPLLSIPELQIIAVCDPQKYAIGYYDWGKTGLRDDIRKALQMPDWQPGGDNVIPGGLDNGKQIVDTYYSKFRSQEKLKGCKGYADFREMFEKEKDLNAVKVMTPDHLHGVIAMAAMKRGIGVTIMR